jgi:hypothetical protein
VDRDELENRKREVERRYGAWISHNLQLQDDLYTIQRGVAGGNEARVRRVVQLVADLAHGPIEKLRVLDLGAFEGLFAVELARQGATVVAIEGRDASLEKMRLAKEALELENLEVRLEDVRALDPQRHGAFTWFSAWGSSITSMRPTSSSCLNACGTSAVTSSSLRPASHPTRVNGESIGAASIWVCRFRSPLRTRLHSPAMPCGPPSATP